MIEKIEASTSDQKTLKELAPDPKEIADDFYDYSKVVVKKPWGYEYLIFQNDLVAVWVLYIRKNAQTSMHCHPSKKTSLVVLEGQAQCSTLDQKFDRHASSGLMLGKEVFHRTKALSDQGAFVMEIESPVNKRDLVRLKDQYGREGMGYEDADQHSLNIQNYNHISFKQSQIHHNLKKRFGECSLIFKKLSDEKSLDEVLDLAPEDVICMLRGELMDQRSQTIIEVGDTMSVAALRDRGELKIGKHTEMLIIKKTDKLMKISDYVAEFLAQNNLTTVFSTPGIANVHLLDSIGRHERVDYICTQVEKSGSHAAEAFSKLKSELSALVVSSGASSVNSIPGVANAWIDSTPMLVISGQARSDQLGSETRQLGNKSIEITDLVKDITKYAKQITDPNLIRFELEKALHIATTGRPGPVWIDLPIDIQGMMIDGADLQAFSPDDVIENKSIESQAAEALKLLKESKRPVLLAGNGIRLSKAEKEFLEFAKKTKIPVLTSRRGADLIEDNHPLFFGRPGAYGQRAANFIVQNSDLLLSVGCRHAFPLIGTNPALFAREAKKIVVDIDPNEIEKKTIQADLAIPTDARQFFQACNLEVKASLASSEWIERCKKWRKDFPSDQYSASPELKSDRIYPLTFVRELAEQSNEDEVLVVDGGPPLINLLQGYSFKKGQRLVSSTGLELPGFALSGAIGASIAQRKKPITCVLEDRGFQISVQELQTIADYQIPLKIIVLKSKGHSIIRNIQKDFFGGRFVGTDQEIRGGTVVPVKKVAEAYGLEALEAKTPNELGAALKSLAKTQGPAVLELEVENDQSMMPRPGFKIKEDGKWVANPIEDMYPSLDRKLLKENMIIDLPQED